MQQVVVSPTSVCAVPEEMLMGKTLPEQNEITRGFRALQRLKEHEKVTERAVARQFALGDDLHIFMPFTRSTYVVTGKNRKEATAVPLKVRIPKVFRKRVSSAPVMAAEGRPRILIPAKKLEGGGMEVRVSGQQEIKFHKDHFMTKQQELYQRKPGSAAVVEGSTLAASATTVSRAHQAIPRPLLRNVPLLKNVIEKKRERATTLDAECSSHKSFISTNTPQYYLDKRSSLEKDTKSNLPLRNVFSNLRLTFSQDSPTFSRDLFSTVVTSNPTTIKCDLAYEEPLKVKHSSPTERIAVLYSPTSHLRSLARNEDMIDFGCSVMYRNVEPPLIPLIPGVPGEDRSMCRFLSIEDFDNSTYELYSPHEWVALGAENKGTPAQSRFVTYINDNKNGGMKEIWMPCKVISYNDITKLFTIVFDYNNKKIQKQISRLNIFFSAENFDTWKKRVADAMTLRDEAEAKIRYRLYVENIQSDLIPPSDEGEIDRILGLVAVEFPLCHLNIIEDGIQDVKKLYEYGLKNAFHQYQVKSHAEGKRIVALQLPSPTPLEEPSLASMQMSLATVSAVKAITCRSPFLCHAKYEYENDQQFSSPHSSPCMRLQSPSSDTASITVSQPFFNFYPIRSFIGANLLSAHTLTRKSIYFSHARLSRFEGCLLCDTAMKNINLPCEVSTFEERQRNTTSSLVGKLHKDWLLYVILTIQNELGSYFNFYENSEERYKLSRMCRFFKMINLMLGSQLRTLLIDSIDDYTKLFMSFRVVLPEGFDAEQDKIEELPQDSEERAFWEEKANLLIYEKTIEQEKEIQALEALMSKKDKRKEQKRRTTASPTVDNEEEKDDVGNSSPVSRKQFTAVDVLPLPYVGSHTVFSQRVLAMALTPNGLNPLFVIRLVAPSGKIIFQPLLEEVEDVVEDTFHDFFVHTDKLNCVESFLFPSLNLNRTPLKPLDKRNHFVSDRRQIVTEILQDNFVSARQIQNLYEVFGYLLELDIDSFIAEFNSKNPHLHDYDIALNRLQRDTERIIHRTLNQVKFELFEIDCKDIKTVLTNKSKMVADAVLQLLAENTNNAIKQVIEEFQSIHTQLQKRPPTPEKLQVLKEYINTVKVKVAALDDKFDKCTKSNLVMKKYHFITDVEHFLNYWKAYEWPKKIDRVLEGMQFKCREYQAVFQQQLKENYEKMAEKIIKLSNIVEEFFSERNEKQYVSHFEKIIEIEKTFDEYEKLIQLYNSHEVLFGLAVTPFDGLKHLRHDFAPYKDLWEVVYKFNTYSESWMSSPVETLNGNKIDNLVQSCTVKINQILHTFADEGPLKVAKFLKKELDDFRQNIPLIFALKNNLQQAHWKAIFNIIGADKNIIPEEKTLQDFIKLGMLEHLNEIEEIAENARKMYSLQSELFEMESEWKRMSFEIEPFQHSYLLKSSDTLQQTLDDHIMRTQSLLGKPIVRQGVVPGVAAKAKSWYNILNNIQTTLDAWYKCQVTWVYLVPIFLSADISKAMPQEAITFANITVSWIKIMDKTRYSPLITSRCADESLIVDLTSHNEVLEEILKKLHAFLETKRMAFPRFYFISNEELLQILSDSQDPFLVQPYLNKCFEGIKSIQFEDNLDIVAMQSAEKETVPFVKKVNPTDYNNQVEKWLQAVETMMMVSIREQLHLARKDYITQKRINFVRKWPGQCVIAICSHYWTMEATSAMDDEGGQVGLIRYYETCNEQLDDLIMLVRDRGLSAVERATLEALVVIEVHARDIVRELVDKNVGSSLSFDWLAQLRYYWTDDDHMDVCQINASRRYGYEYLGNTGRLVITQLTDRCYRTLMGALNLNYGGAPEGPAGTGKTETTKDLAKALGKYCIVYNCTDQITAKDMAKLFKGLAQSGSWGCFDEFNRIEIQVLSVIAQQVATIQDSIVLRKTEFIFEGAQIMLKHGCAIFITMNPGYAGRAELPDNLKALFRPVAMMVPNYAMIGQIQLFSYGFLHGKELAEKIVATYRLCSEQLSSQDHYDYGMRAVKAVLTAAGRLKRQFPDEDESILMLRSIQDVNVPKFLAQDVELFKGIISDLFQSSVLTPLDYQDLTAGIEKVCSESSLQPTSYFKTKCYQTYEMILVRHGIMLVGFSFGGKTEILRTLSQSLTIMSQEQKEEKAILMTINPKSITMAQLYGVVDPTGEWTDGILSMTFRTAASNTAPDRQWLVLDGPVDAVWIENMNTVLDDNKKLCLQNGDIVPMTKAMNMIFEVQDLAHASPATVSRCGMVYVEPETMGWEPLMTSYLNVMPSFIHDSEDCLIIFETLITLLMKPMLEFVRKHCTPAIPQGSSVAVASFIKLFGALLHPNDPNNDTDEDVEPILIKENFLKPFMEGSFLFALTWSVGGCLYPRDRKRFNKHLCETILSLQKDHGLKLSVSLPPNEVSFYDGKYDFVENEIRFINWIDTLFDFIIPEDAEYQNIIVPTADTVKYLFLLNKFVKFKCPLLYIGDTGVGKSVLIKNYCANLPRESYKLNIIQFSAQTTANDAQRLIDSKCERRRKGVYGPSPPAEMLIFIDDLNMPALEEYGAQPPIELIRQWHDHGGWYNHSKDNMDFREVENILFVAAMGPAGGGRNPVTQRFTRHYNSITIPAFDDVTLKKIFGTLIDWIMCKGYPASLRSLGPQLVDATCEIYDILVEKLKPTPEKSHYTFNMRDASKLFQGISMANAEKILDSTQLYRLWVHEVLRAFADRFIEQSDTDWFITELKTVMKKNFKVSYQSVCCSPRPDDQNIMAIKRKNISNSENPLIFADFMSKKGKYEEVADMNELRKILETKLEAFNTTARSGTMDLVIFNYVIEHVARISRILKQHQGNALLIGVGGSGRHSCTKLAAFASEHQYETIQASKGLKRSDFHDTIRGILIKTGQIGTPVTFCLADTQINDSSFFEDICNLLNTGEVPGMFDSKQDRDTLDNALDEIKILTSKDATREELVIFFVSRCRYFLHIVLCFSPIGRGLREKLRQFPSLVNCTTINFFRKWPTEGLTNVAWRFLERIDYLSDSLQTALRTCFVQFHEDIEDLGKIYFLECRQQTYVTPTSYLGLLKAFQNLLHAKRAELLGMRKRYDGGLSQLIRTEEEVAVMKEELAIMLPELEKKAKTTSELIAIVERENAEAEIIRLKVATEEETANKTAKRAKMVKDKAQKKVDEATPMLEAAKKAAENLDNAALAEVKQTKKVIEGSVVVVVLEGLCKMLGGKYKPKATRDPLTGKMSYDYFGHAIRNLLTASFKSTLTNFANDMDELATNENMASVEKMLTLPSFLDKNVARASIALLGISHYIKNMVDYFNINKIVKPLLAQAASAQTEYEAAMRDLNEKKEELRIINEHLNEKKKRLQTETKEMERLERSVKDTQTKILRAVKLIDGLGGEKVRYQQESQRYAESYDKVVGDVALASGMIAYLGPFQSKYRQSTIAKWCRLFMEHKIPTSAEFTLENFLGDSIEIQKWKLQQLPSDSFSVDNAIIMKNSLSYPLMIDPQQQANKWIKNMEHKNGLQIIRLSDKNYTNLIAHCVREGLPCLLENVGEELDPQLENLLLKNLIKEGNNLTVTIDEAVEWNPHFRFYMTTKIPRPHYQPEVSTKIAIINFLITETGLKDQLQQRVMMSERRDVEEKRQSMTLETAQNKTSLKHIEDTILGLLSGSESLLESETAITELGRSKFTSDRIAARQKDIEEMNRIAERTRKQFVPVAHVGARLFFCITELSNIDPMYQYSLHFYISLFQSALNDSEQAPDDIPERIKNIIETFEVLLYRNICRSLFVKDQLLFSFMMCIKLFDLDPKEIRWLAMGGFDLDEGLPKNALNQWLPNLNWKLLWRASTQLPDLKDLLQNVQNNEKSVQEFYDASDPLTVDLPEVLSSLKEIHTLIFARCLRPDKLVPAVSHYVEANMGKFFIEAPLFNLEHITDEVARDPSIAIIFVLCPGADPNAELDRVAEIKGINGKRLMKLSLGQGQDAAARELINDGNKVGNWVLLQNCHLYKDFMGELAQIIEDYSKDGVKESLHKEFRLWLTSLPSEHFPVGILQNSVKLVQEPPKGLKNNLLRSYTSDPISNPDFFDTCIADNAFKRLLLGIALFHSIVQERRRFGPLGWNIPYEFNDTDMRISVQQLHMFLDENDEIPYAALTYLIGQCNYGGRVTDEWDRRCLSAILALYLTPSILEEDYSPQPDFPEYQPPTSGVGYESYLNYIKSLPAFQRPEVFGLHVNADITKDDRDARLLMASMISTQPREAPDSGGGEGGDVMDPKTIVMDAARDVYSRIPEPFDTEAIMQKYPIAYNQSMNTVLLQELIRFNRLLIITRETSLDIQKAIKGEIVMNNELEQIFNAIYNGNIPQMWKKRSYPSLKPFGSYISDLIKRINFFKKWIDNGPPTVFWISGFFFTQSFFTGVMQNYARTHKIEIDKLEWDFTVLGEKTEMIEFPKDDCYIDGLFLEGAGWNADMGVLVESKPKTLYEQFPIMYLKPVVLDSGNMVPFYTCPTYKTTDRRGVLSTTGHSTNFILPMKLPRRLNDKEEHWVLRGTALFTQLEY